MSDVTSVKVDKKVKDKLEVFKSDLDKLTIGKVSYSDVINYLIDKRGNK